MTSILKTCTPRHDLVSGSFNPEIFMASLRQVVGNYRGDIKVTSVYSNAESFFKEATPTTLGMKQVANHVMRRLSGDKMVPFLTRLETDFGGGKTPCTSSAASEPSCAIAATTKLPQPSFLTTFGEKLKGRCGSLHKDASTNETIK